MTAERVGGLAVALVVVVFCAVVLVEQARVVGARQHLVRERHRAWRWCPCGRLAVTAVTEPSTVWLFGRCASHAQVPATARWVCEVVTGARVGAWRPMLPGERMGEPIACAVPVREGER